LSQEGFHRDNPYVPCEYLRAWESAQESVCVYRIIVSHEKVPLWSKKSIRGIAYRAHLYTRLAVGGVTDEMVKWFDWEYETPSAEVLRKVTSSGRLAQADWRVLVRFLAVQDLRNPARLVEFLQRWYKSLPGVLEKTLQESAEKLAAMKARGEEVHLAPHPLGACRTFS